jgi:UDP-galactopyranose mutase
MFEGGVIVDQGLGSVGEARLNQPPTIVCFSHLRWDFVFQRPQQLMSRFAKTSPVIFWEEPLIEPDLRVPELQVRSARSFPNVTVVTPRLPEKMKEEDRTAALTRLLDAFIASRPRPLVRWYYTPMMLPFSRQVEGDLTVYDCMDELSAFRFAPPELLSLENELLQTADVVFTGGHSLYEAKKDRHANIHPFPSSVDRAHFTTARAGLPDPADQSAIARPRLGFYGVIDERLDLELLAAVADARPEWQLVMVGPVVKIDEADLPRRDNIHYLGGKDYSELPTYLSGWNVAMMPFAINESTRFISPTKTPEYLAGGKPVVSTPIRDVERHYSKLAAVQIASSAEEFVAACEDMLALDDRSPDWLQEVDLMLASMSWDLTQARMAALVEQCMGDEALAVGAPLLAVAAR